MYLAEFSLNMVALLFASMKISVISLMSVLIIFVLTKCKLIQAHYDIEDDSRWQPI